MVVKTVIYRYMESILGFCSLFLSIYGYSQGVSLPLTNEDSYHIMDRFEILSGISSNFHSSQKPFTRGDISRYALQLDSLQVGFSKRDKEDLQYIFDDNNEWLGGAEFNTSLTGTKESQKIYLDSAHTFYTYQDTGANMEHLARSKFSVNKRPLLKYLYRTPANFYEFEDNGFSIKLNPIINFTISKDKYDDQLIFQNLRGLEVRGSIDSRLYYYANILEQQLRFPNYATERIYATRTIIGFGYVKPYRSSIFSVKDGFDLLNAQAYIGFNVMRHIGFQFGYGNNFLGDGYRSMFLSNSANNYLYLKINTKVWKFQYQNLFTELNATSPLAIGGDSLTPKKYMAAHSLSFNVNSNLNFGLFEAVVFGRSSGFELNYLNPIIFYQTANRALGSPDKLLAGLNGKWNFLHHFSLYGQLAVNEFKFNELFVAGQGWWGNKYGAQIGLKYMNAFGVDHLDMRIERNKIKPYTYTDKDPVDSYTHDLQSLAHPLGANLEEVLMTLRFQPSRKWIFDTRVISTQQGEDANGINWGGDILLPSETRYRDYGNATLQGVKADIFIGSLDVSYVLYHNVFLDFHAFYRNKVSDDPSRNLKTLYFGGGFRMNMGMMRNDY